MNSAQQLNDEASRLNRFDVPTVPQAAQRNDRPVYIFNVGSETYTHNIGSMGEFVVPACKPSAEVSTPLVLPEVLPEFYDQGTDRKGLQLWDADVIARDIIGHGPLETHTANHEFHGVFATHHNPPTKEEIAAAREKRAQWLRHMVSEADGLALQGEAGNRNINVPHRKAALELKVKRSWVQPTQQQANCPACGGDVPAGAAVCRHCTAVLDEEAARKFFPERFAVKEPEPEPEVQPKPQTARKG